MVAYSVELEGLNLDLKDKDLKHDGLLKKTDMHKLSSEKGFQEPLFMKILPKLISEQFQRLRYSQADSHAKTSAMQDREQVLKAREAVSGKNTREPLCRYDQDSHSLRTSQLSLTGDSTQFSATLPKSGMMRNGIVYELPMWERGTEEKESSLLHTEPKIWHTPTRGDINATYDKRKTGGGQRKIPVPNLAAQIQMWPAPTQRDYKGARKPETLTNVGRNENNSLPDKVGTGQLNPTWVEWLMGFPIGWTELDASETQSYRKSQKSLRKQSK